METTELAGQNAAPEKTEAIRQALIDRAVDLPDVIDPHDVRVRETPTGLVVNYHCRLDPALTVEAAHIAVDQLDRRIRLDYPEISRIVGHAEPLVR